MKTTLTAIIPLFITISLSQEAENTTDFFTNEDGEVEIVNVTPKHRRYT